MMNQDPHLAGQLVVSIDDILEAGKMQAVVFDHAGVLVDCEIMHAQARATLINSYGYNISVEDGRSYKGHGEKMLYKMFVEKNMFPLVVQAIETEAQHLGRESWALYREHHTQVFNDMYERKTEEQRLATIFGYVPEVLAAARRRRLPVAVVSNSDRPEVERDSGMAIAKANVLLTASGDKPFKLTPAFNFFTTADDLNAAGCPHKPSPAPYLMCFFELAKLEERKKPLKDVTKALVFEDAKKGLDAAFAAGASVIQVLNQTDHPGTEGRDPRALGYIYDHHLSSTIIVNRGHALSASLAPRVPGLKLAS